MRTLSIWLATVLWAGGLAAQEAATVTARLTIPDLLRLTAEPETVVGEEGGRVVKQVRLHVEANRTWALLVSCAPAAASAAEGGSERSLDGAPSAATESAAVWWRTSEGGTLRRPCSADERAVAAEGGRGRALIVLEYAALDAPAAVRLFHALVAR